MQRPTEAFVERQTIVLGVDYSLISIKLGHAGVVPWAGLRFAPDQGSDSYHLQSWPRSTLQRDDGHDDALFFQRTRLACRPSRPIFAAPVVARPSDDCGQHCYARCRICACSRCGIDGGDLRFADPVRRGRSRHVIQRYSRCDATDLAAHDLTCVDGALDVANGSRTPVRYLLLERRDRGARCLYAG